MKLIVGLGNPGKEYALTRHNVGFRCINRVARKHNISVDRKRGKAIIGEGVVAGGKVVLAKPQTFMNASGESVRLLLQQYGLQPADAMIVYDDMDLPLGKVRVRPCGGAGGHHGMESIIRSTGSDEFPRIRIGISHPAAGVSQQPDDVVEYVLSGFSPEEEKVADEAIGRAAEAVEVILSEGLEQAMNRFNQNGTSKEKPRSASSRMETTPLDSNE
ncbi:MAG: aminoacyl-tRNA hydrolase [Chloroflexi bacterium]|nr:aminoacyl-tRNA hydrolase [Chloroflexota bacterium]